MFSLLVAGLLFAPAFCLGVVTYSRTPAGFTIQNPVSFDIAFDELADICPTPPPPYWTVYAQDAVLEFYFPECLNGDETPDGYIFEENLPLGEYAIVMSKCYATLTDCENHTNELSGNTVFEDEGFEVIAGGPASIFTIPAGAVGTTTNVIGDLVDAIFPFIALFAGVPLAFVVIAKFFTWIP